MSNINKAIEILKAGGIIIFPTDTAFAIGCRIDDKKAVERLFKIRKRPQSQAVPVLCDTVKMAQNYLRPIPKEVVDKLIEPYWPGALTIVFSCLTNKVPSLVRGGGQTLGVRIPSHSVARRIIREVGVPILGPSANFHGEKTPYRLDDLSGGLIKMVDFVMPGECLACKESTVIDCSAKPWRILRQGAIRIQKSKFKSQNYNLKFKNKKTLLIDTASNREIVVGISIDGKKYLSKKKIGRQKAQVVLPMIDNLLLKHKLKLSDLTDIEVDQGPGSFTGLRVGISIANALSFALKIPVNKKTIVEPLYE